LKKRAKTVVNAEAISSPSPSAPATQKSGKRRLFKARKSRIPRGKKQRRGFLSNIKIAPRLLSCFLIIALLSAGMGVYASLSLNTVSIASDDMYGKILLPTKNAYDLSLSIEDQMSTLRKAITDDSESMVHAYASDIKNKSNSCDSSISMIKGLISDDKMADYEDFMTVYEKYKTDLNATLDTLAAGDVQSIADDLKLYGTFYTSHSAVLKAASALRYAISGDAASMATNNNKTASTVLIITIASVSLVVVLSVLFGILMARGISRPVKSLTRDVKRLAAGETDIDLDTRSTKDEIGQMRDAIHTIVRVVQSLAEDTGMLVEAASQGRLSTRADAERHTGVYRRIVEGVNATLDAMIEPINESAQVLDELSQGNLDVSVTGDFQGDFSLVGRNREGHAHRLHRFRLQRRILRHQRFLQPIGVRFQQRAE
jgi:methyl-accepting chemotaxis protein